MQPALASDPASLSRLKPSNGNTSHAAGSIGAPDNAQLIEELYEQYKIDPQSIDPVWRGFFEGFDLGCQIDPKQVAASAPAAPAAPSAGDLPHRLKQARLYNLLFAYRTLGHQIANLDPLGFNKSQFSELNLENFRFSETDLDTVFDSGTLDKGGDRTLREIMSILKETYCGNVAVEYMHMQNFAQRRWLRDRLESTRLKPSYSTEKKKRILNCLMRAEEFEQFLHTRYVGQKRFSLEGGETLIPALDAIVENCPKAGVQQIIMGMAHRGRLNVLANILGKDYKFLFNEFAENYTPEGVHGDGDVKYHLGYAGTQTTTSGDKVNIQLAPNPSHLEAVDPVVEGKARAYQRLLNDTAERKKVLPILIHGDAAFIGQGVVQETFNFSQLDGYKTGGTIHIVVNNQIGFTTSPQDGRSTQYCTAIAKAFGLPVFHVNGDDPLSAVFVAELALEWRQNFGRDVVIDIVCYRRHGHNEGDEPSFTQPLVYKALQNHPLISDTFLNQLIQSGDITEAEGEDYRTKFEAHLNDAMQESKAITKAHVPKMRAPLSCAQFLEPVDTRISKNRLIELGHKITDIPLTHRLNPKIEALVKNRRAMADGQHPVDWAMAEHLAFASLLTGGVPIRLSGQDSRRGTFGHRHSVLYDLETRERYIPLRNLSPDQESFCCYNSPLSEYAVLGFDYGYSLDVPKMLILWEAQFGDFANGAQVMIDQYISSCESKWGTKSRITLLLPHGYDGQGPEHSSARLERFLQLCAEDNMAVANCTTPANYFHLLRTQALRTLLKPLIVMTPKSLLRAKFCVSTLDELAEGTFHRIIPDASVSQAARVILCSGKVYYDLEAYRSAHHLTDVALVRVEQIYPLDEAALTTAAAAHRPGAKIVWCQEESQNMGAWSFLEPRLRKLFGREIFYAGRDASSSPAVGSKNVHDLEQKDLVNQAFTL
jgi:2-oxoglutarate dehydrogenase E1 component